ncbi:hypothetical protein A6B43_08685 [Vespertiliibacter pulmonis]|nr:hypothetical protein [Vespertiliibacter pulmonis]QLB21595.1 hypothetical protein A6B43_08685 [Vespertiliibacter pulmonis]
MAMPEEQLSQNPQYQALLAKGLSPAHARTELASSFIEHGGEVLATGVSSAVLSGVGGLGRIGQVGKGMLGSTAGKFVSEAVTEPADEVFQQFMGNKAIHDIDPTHSLTDGLGEAAAGGLLFGVAGGGVAAADSAYRTSQQQAKQSEASDDTIDEVISSTKTSEQANQPNQTTNTVQEQALEKVLSSVEDETLRNDYFDELKQDIADGLLEKRVAEGGEYGKLAQAYLNSVSEFLDTVQPNTVQQENQSEQEFQTEPTTQNSIDEERFSQYSNEVNQLLDGYQQGQLSDTDVSNRYHDIAQRFPDHHTLAAEHYRRQQEDEQQQALYSRSPMKSVEANIARGREAMVKAILDKADVKRGMYNNEFGWVDFVWGDDGLTKPRNKRGEPVGKGISHIIEARMRKNNMSEPEVVEMLTNDIVETIAKGTVVNENPQSKLELDYLSPKNGRVYRATLVRNKGNNAWVLTAFDNSAKYVNEGAIRKGKDKSNPTTIDPTLTRVDRGASFSASGSEQLANNNGLSNNTAVELGRPINISQLNDTHAHSQRGRGVVAENGPNLTDSQNAVNNKSQIIQDQQALSRILGEETASHIEVVDRNTVKPPKGESVESLASKNVEGWFDVGTQKLYLYSDNITATENMTREERLAWVAWHELAHAGMRVKLGYSFHNILKGASEHVVVKVIARKIRDKFGYDEEVAVEEAMAELYAAYETGRWDELGKRYNTSVHRYWHKSVGDWLIKLANYFRRIMGAIVGKDFTQTMTTREVFDTLRGIKEGVNALGKKSVNQTANQ